MILFLQLHNYTKRTSHTIINLKQNSKLKDSLTSESLLIELHTCEDPISQTKYAYRKSEDEFQMNFFHIAEWKVKFLIPGDQP